MVAYGNTDELMDIINSLDERLAKLEEHMEANDDEWEITGPPECAVCSDRAEAWDPADGNYYCEQHRPA